MSFLRRIFGIANSTTNKHDIYTGVNQRSCIRTKEARHPTTKSGSHGDYQYKDEEFEILGDEDVEERVRPPVHDKGDAESGESRGVGDIVNTKGIGDIANTRGVGDILKSAFIKSMEPIEDVIQYHFNDTDKASESPDLKIYVEDCVFIVHQDLLVEKSGYVRALLVSGMLDSELMQTTRELRFHDVPPTANAMRIILDYLYDRNVLIPSSKEEQVDLLAAADFLEVPLHPKLFRKIVTLENWRYYLELAKTYNWTQLEGVINLVLAAHYRFLKDGTELSSLSREAIAKVEEKTQSDEIKQFSKETLCMVLQHESDKDDNSGKILCCYDDRIDDWVFLDVFPGRCTEFHSTLHSSYTHNYVGLKIGHWSRTYDEYDPYRWREMQMVTYNPLGDMKLAMESFIYDSFTGIWRNVSHMTPPALSKADFLLAQSEDVLYAIPPYMTKKRGLVVYAYENNAFSPLRWQRHVVVCPHFVATETSSDAIFLNACLHRESIYALCLDRETDSGCNSLFVARVTPNSDRQDDSDFFDADFGIVSMDTAVSDGYVRIFSNGDDMVLLASASSRPSVNIPPNLLIIFTLQKDTIATFKAVSKISTMKLGIRSLHDFLKDCKIAIVGCHLYILSADMKEDMLCIDIKAEVGRRVSLPHFIFEPWKDILAIFPLDVPQELGMCATKLEKKNIYIIRDDI